MAFNGCTGLSSVRIPDSVTSIGYAAFGGCTGLTSVTIPDRVTSIGERAFRRCTSLTSITIPDSITSISGLLFDDCAGLTSVTIPNSVTSIDRSAFYGCTGLMSIMIPDSVTSIGRAAFGGCTGLTSVTIPDSVTSIGDSAFWGCTGLTSAMISNSVTSIVRTFYGCTGLTSVTIPDSVTSIVEAFSGCTGLTSVTIPDSVTSIVEAFRGCTGLTSVTIPNSITNIDNGCFSGCKGLTSVTIPNSVTSIGEWAFCYCTGLTAITIPDSVTSIGREAFRGCAGLTSVTIPNSVTSIGVAAFDDCARLTSVTIPESVTSINDNMFSNCTGLTSITIPNSVTSIGSAAFHGCTGLTSITISNSVTSIGWYAFSDCTDLTDVYYGGTETQWNAITIRNENFPLTSARIHWSTNNSYTVSFDANGGTVSPTSKTVTNGETYGDLPTATRSSYSFDGWFTSVSGGTQITSSTTVDLTADRTLYAHWTLSNAPTLDSLSYSFKNSYDGFGYPNPYYIPYARYSLVFGNTVKAKALHKLQYTEGSNWSGNCYGMSTTTGMFFERENGIELTSFHLGATVPSTLSISDQNSEWNLTLTEFIEAMQISQYAEKIQNDYNQNTDLEGLCRAVSAFSETGGNPVVIAVMRQMGSSKNGHALVGYKIEAVNATTSRLFVYDCNYPGVERYITLTKDASGAFTGWYYPLNNQYDWGSAYKGCSISYIPYSDFHQIWVNLGRANTMCIFTVNSDVLIRDMDGNSVASIEDGELFTGRNDIVPVVQFGIMDNGTFPARSTTSILLPADLYTVERLSASNATLQSIELFEATMIHVEQSASITTTADKITFAVDDESGINYVSIDGDESGKTYDVTLNSTLAGNLEEVQLTGTVLDKAMMFSQMNGSLNLIGASSSARLIVDGKEISIGEVSSEAFPVVSFLANDGTGTMSPRTADEGQLVLPVCGFTPPDGCAFRAWQINGIEYLPGEICTLTENAAAIALWSNSTDMPYILENVSHEGDKVHVSIRNQCGNGALLLVGAYQDNGKMLECELEEISIPLGSSDTVTVMLKQADEAEIRVFLLDSLTFQPLCKYRII